MPIFQTPVILTKEQMIAKDIDYQLRNTATAMKNAYNCIRNIIYNNPNLSPNDAYVAFQMNSTSGLTADQLGQCARIIKAAINSFAPGTIVDEVPEAKISYE